jgi:small GTP-binding protein
VFRAVHTGVGKTSLVHRYVKNAFVPPSTTSTIGASFLTKRVVDIDTSTVVRLQIWDTAGQERFRSISKLYYRGANAAVLCYDITDPDSFAEMGRWLLELKQNLGEEIVLHVVGTKSDVVAEDPSRRMVPFERCIAYVAEHLFPQQSHGQPAAAPHQPHHHHAQHQQPSSSASSAALASPHSNRSSGFWGQDIGWDCCHEISARDGEGVEEVFRVITRKLVEQRLQKLEAEQWSLQGRTPGVEGATGYFDIPHNGSFRVGYGDKRRSWLGFPTTPGSAVAHDRIEDEVASMRRKRGGRCC